MVTEIRKGGFFFFKYAFKGRRRVRYIIESRRRILYDLEFNIKRPSPDRGVVGTSLVRDARAFGETCDDGNGAKCRKYNLE